MTDQRGLGWLPDVPKHKDYDAYHPEVNAAIDKNDRHLAQDLESLRQGAAVALPDAVDLRGKQWFSPIEKQGALNCCTAHATVALVEYFQRRASGKHIDVSPLFLYKVSRNLVNGVGDIGAQLRTAMEALTLFGAPPEKYWPYLLDKFDVEPPSFVYALAQNYKAVKYFRLDPGATTAEKVLQAAKVLLAHEFPSVFGFPVFEEYKSLTVDNNIRLPGPNSIYSGGHANVVAGYDDKRKIGTLTGALLVRNSFGEDWGDGGYAWMPYEYVLGGLTADWWTLAALDWVKLDPFERVA